MSKNTPTPNTTAHAKSATSFVAQVQKKIAAKQPQGWYNRDEVAKELGKSPNQTGIILNDLCKRGIAERKKWSYMTGDLGTKTVYVYKVKK